MYCHHGILHKYSSLRWSSFNLQLCKKPTIESLRPIRIFVFFSFFMPFTVHYKKRKLKGNESALKCRCESKVFFFVSIERSKKIEPLLKVPVLLSPSIPPCKIDKKWVPLAKEVLSSQRYHYIQLQFLTLAKQQPGKT